MNKKIATILLLFGCFTVANAQISNSAKFKESYYEEQDGDYVSAIKSIQAIYQEDFYEVNLRLGWLHYQNNDQMKAKEYYQKAIDLKPNSVEAKLGMLYPLAEMGEWNEVVTVYKQITDSVPGNTVIRYNLAYVQYKHLKNYKEALEHVKFVTSCYPFDYDANMLIGRVYRSMGKIKEAKEHFLIAHYIDPITGEALKEIGKF